MRLVHSPDLLSYRFREWHPLRPERYLLTYELLRAYGLLGGPIQAIEPRRYGPDVLLLAHDEEYVDFIKSASELGEGYLDYGDTPAFKGCFEAALLHVSATLTAAEEAARGEPSMNMAGGYHHARRLSAGGFCIFNDLVIAVRYAMERGLAARVAVVDLDAHHGDGTQELLYSEPVLKVDLHEDGRFLYPGTGFTDELGEGEGYGYMVNVPMPPHSGDVDYAYAFDELVVPLLEWYKPDFLVCQCGVDGHYADPLTHLELTSEGYAYMARRLSEACSRLCGGRCLLLGGGGYSLAAVPRMWLVIVSAFAGLELSDELPSEWRELFREVVGAEPPERLSDEVRPSAEREPSSAVREVVEDLKAKLRDAHGPVL